MKRVINGILVILMLSFTACSKSSDEIDNGKSQVLEILIGNWDGDKLYTKVFFEKSGEAISWKIEAMSDGYSLSFSKDGKCLRTKANTISKVVDFSVDGEKLIIGEDIYTVSELSENKLALQQTETKYDYKYQETIKTEYTYYYNKVDTTK